MKELIKLYAACSAVFLCSAVVTSAAVTIIGQDATDDPAYADGWNDGDNGGTGFTAWTFVNGPEAYSLGSSTNQSSGAPDIDMGGSSFRMLNTTDGYYNAGRGLAAPLSTGDRLSLNMTAFGAGDQNKGFSIVNTDGSTLLLVRFPYTALSNSLSIDDNVSTYVFMPPMTEPESYVCSILQKTESSGTVSLTSGAGDSISLDYAGVVNGISLYSRGDPDGTENEAMYFNSFKIESGVPIPPTPPNEDDANEEVYDNGWTAGDNGGGGFGPWTMAGWAEGETSIGDSTGLDPAVDINSNGKCFRAISTDGYLHAYREFSKALEVGQTFSIDFAAGFSENNQGMVFRAKGVSNGIIGLANRVGGWQIATYFDPGSGDDVIDYFIDAEHSDAADNTWFRIELTQETAASGIYTITRFGDITGTMRGTYDGVVGALTVYCSVATDDDEHAMYFNNLAIIDPFLLEITDYSIEGANSVVTFTSEAGQIYKVEGSNDLVADDWASVSPIIEADAEMTTNSLPLTSAAYLRIAEADRFFEDFEGDTSDWVMDNQTPASGRTEWEIGVPMTTNTNLVVTNAFSPTSCAATVLDDLYGADNTMAASTLRSPVIAIGSPEFANLSFYECASVENYDEIGLNILDSSGTLVTNLYSYGGDEGLDHLFISNWTERVIQLPMPDLPEDIILEFYSNPDSFNEGEFSGWYIDDVKIK